MALSHVNLKVLMKLDSHEIIQLDAPAVEHITYGCATVDDMYEALDHSGMRRHEIYEEFDRIVGDMSDVPQNYAVAVMRGILFDRYKSELLKVVAHKVPVI